MSYLNKQFVKNNYNILFYIMVFVIGCAKGIGLNGNNSFYLVSFIVVFLFFFIKIFLDTWRKKEIIFILISLFVIFLNYSITKSYTLLVTFILLVGTKNVSINRIFYIILCTAIIGYVAVITSSALNLIPENSINYVRNGIVLQRSSLGFSYPNLLHILLLKIFLLITYFYYKKINILWISLLLCINYVIYTFSLSRGSFLAIHILFLLILISRIKYFRYWIFKLTIYIQYIFTFITILFGAVLKGTPIFNELNLLLSGRLYYVMEQFTRPLNFFGDDFSGMHIRMIPDNSYSALIFSSGLIITLVMLYGYYKVAKEVYKNRNIMLSIIFCTISIFLFVENYMFTFTFNFTLIYMMKYFYGELDVFKPK